MEEKRVKGANRNERRTKQMKEGARRSNQQRNTTSRRDWIERDDVGGRKSDANGGWWREKTATIDQLVEEENGNDGGRRKRLRSIGWWREKTTTMMDGEGRKRLRSEGFEWWVADENDD
ncbi:hypothetical protein E6C27_scaffold21G004100 [Cucumis melo var. makuwa]|uniref:Uncharacterized protein n=1 Tax=Cucumis melo var. makuwa TaxID=1194695 RepID=A0A5A7VKQ7_CUCMM|nr:hypothetical protein E6C27_scaffold21G004100 [Cucumis melo var. makuwa]